MTDSKTMDKRRKVTIQDISAAVVHHFIDTGRDCDVATIARKVGCSESTVRQRIQINMGVPGCDESTITKDTMSRNYKHMHHGVVQVRVYTPTKHMLRSIIRLAKFEMETDHLQRAVMANRSDVG